MADRTKISNVVARYAREVSPTKRGERWEAIRLAKPNLSGTAIVSLEHMPEFPALKRLFLKGCALTPDALHLFVMRERLTTIIADDAAVFDVPETASRANTP